jgi:hypothetical protein
VTLSQLIRRATVLLIPLALVACGGGEVNEEKERDPKVLAQECGYEPTSNCVIVWPPKDCPPEQCKPGHLPGPF